MLHTKQVWRQQKDYMSSGVNMDNFSVLYISYVFFVLIFVQMRIPVLMVTSKAGDIAVCSWSVPTTQQYLNWTEQL